MDHYDDTTISDEGGIEMAMVGTLQEFCPETESITANLECVELFMKANKVEDEREVAVLLSVVGSKTYNLLRSLLSPDSPGDKSYANLERALKAHVEPKPSVIAERFHFHRRSQAPGESVADYVVELKRLAARCEFGEHLGDALRDRLICGMYNHGILKRLLAEKDLTYAKAVEIAAGMEAAEKTTQRLKGPELAVQQVGKSKGPQPMKASSQTQYYRSGSIKHAAASCKFKEATCFNCQKKWHIAKVWRSKKGTEQSRNQALPQQRAHHMAVERHFHFFMWVVKLPNPLPQTWR